MRILIVPSSLRGGARRCMTVAREANATAQRVAGLPSPEGMPPEATSQLRAAVAQLARSSAAAGRQSEFLTARAQRGLMADGPFGSPLDLSGPSLLSPWELPADPKKPKKHHWYDGPLDFLDGAYDETVETVKGVGNTGLGIAAHTIDGDNPLVRIPQIPGMGRLSDHIPFLAKQRRDLDAAADWALHHPGEFATGVGKDLVAYDDHAKGDNAHGAGRNTVGIIGLLAPMSKAGSAAKASRAAGAAKKAEESAARASDDARVVRDRAQREHDQARPPGESTADRLVRERREHYELTRARGQAHLADERLRTEVQEAREAAERAAATKAEAIKEAGKAGGSAAGQSGAKVLDSHGQPRH